MKIKTALLSFIRKIDLFSTNQLFRFKQQGTYGTITGGITTCLLFLMFIIAVIRALIAIRQPSNLTINSKINYQNDPSQYSFTFGTTDIYFALGIAGLNLNQKNIRYFDISMALQQRKFGQKGNTNQLKLVPCDKNVWQALSWLNKDRYNKLNFSNYLCPQLNQTIKLVGKYGSQQFKYVSIYVRVCNNSLDLTRPCASIDLKNIYNVNTQIINSYINNFDITPVSYYLQDRNYFPISNGTFVNANGYLTYNHIETDQSLLPYSVNVQNDAITIDNVFQIKTNPQKNDLLLQINFRKSLYTVDILRAYQKLDELFSYFGGLLGFALLAFFIFNFYSEASYEIDIGQKLFYSQGQNKIQQSNFNFLTYIGYCIYNFMKILNINIEWKSMEIYMKCRQQVQEQLSVSLLLNKIIFLQKCMLIIFQEHQFRAIYLQQKPTVQEAQTFRINHGLNMIIHQNKIQQNGQILLDKKNIRKSQIFNFIMNDILSNKSNKSDLQSIKSKSKQSNQEKFKQNNKIQQYKITQSHIINLNNKNNKNEEKDINLDDIDLFQLILAFSLRGNHEIKDENKANNQIEIPTINIKQPKENENNIKISNNEGIKQFMNQKQDDKYIDKIISDVKLLQNEAKQGNKYSQKIYYSLNNKQTKQNFIILKYLEQLKNIKNKKKQKLRDSNEQIKQQKNNQEINQRQIIFQTNARIPTKHNF